MTTYNGWTNYDTWNTNLWLTADPEIFNRLLWCTSAEEVLDLFIFIFGSHHDNIDKSKVNWEEIFNDYKEREGAKA